MIWRYKINLNEAISNLSERFDLENFEEDAPEEVKLALANEVKKAWPLKRFEKRFLEAKSIAECNRILQKVFDTADREKVCCGF